MSKATITGFHHTAIKVVDFDQSVGFYHALGFDTTRSWGEPPKRAVLLNAGDGNYMEIFEGGDSEAPSEGRVIHFAFRTPDCDAMHAAALQAGATEKMAPKEVTIPSDQGDLPVKISFVFSPSGETIEFFENSLT